MDWCGCSLPDAVKMANDRAKWQWITGLSNLTGPWIQMMMMMMMMMMMIVIIIIAINRIRVIHFFIVVVLLLSLQTTWLASSSHLQVFHRGETVDKVYQCLEQWQSAHILCYNYCCEMFLISEHSIRKMSQPVLTRSSCHSFMIMMMA